MYLRCIHSCTANGEWRVRVVHNVYIMTLIERMPPDHVRFSSGPKRTALVYLT